MKINIFYGSKYLLYSHCAELVSHSSDVLLFDNDPHANRNWGGACRLLEQLESRLPDGFIDQCLCKHWPAAALVLPHIYDSLSIDQRRQCGLFAAQLTSHMTHNWVVQYPIFKEW